MKLKWVKDNDIENFFYSTYPYGHAIVHVCVHPSLTSDIGIIRVAAKLELENEVITLEEDLSAFFDSESAMYYVEKIFLRERISSIRRLVSRR